jgi:hypothetical protein
MMEGRSSFKIFTGKFTGKIPLGRQGIDGRTILEWILKEIGNNMMNWANSTQDRDFYIALVNAAFNLRVT